MIRALKSLSMLVSLMDASGLDLTLAISWGKLKQNGVAFRLCIASRSWVEHHPFSFLVMIPIFSRVSSSG